MIQHSTCKAPSCNCKATFGSFCGRHAPKCIHKNEDGKYCRKACLPGTNVCHLHKHDFLTCDICYKDVNKNNFMAIAHCSHSFCKPCLEKWIETQQNTDIYPYCPMCRAPIEMYSYVHDQIKTHEDLMEWMHGLLIDNKTNKGWENRLRINDELFIMLSTPIGKSFLEKHDKFKDNVVSKLNQYDLDSSSYPPEHEYHIYLSKWKRLLHFCF